MAILLETPTSLSLAHDDLTFLAANNRFIQNQAITTKIELKYYIEVEERGEGIEVSLPHLCLFSKNKHILYYSKNFEKKRYVWHSLYEKINNKNVTRKEYLDVIRYINLFMAPPDRILVENLLQEILNKKEITVYDYNTIDDHILEIILLNFQECNDFLSILPNLYFFSSILNDIIKTIESSDLDFLQYENFQLLKQQFKTTFDNIKLK